LNRELDGGPEIGDLAVILTVVSGGKTTALVNITRHAMFLGKFVVYFTFEDGERKIKSRLMQSIANMTKVEAVSNRDEVVRTKNRFLKRYGGRCEVKDLQSRRSTVSDAAAFVRTLEDNYEQKVDVVVTDYADRFRAQNRYYEPRHALREIFEDCKWLARNLEVVHWTARQVNKTRVGKDIITTDAAGESWGSMESPDLVIGLGRTLQDEALNRITLHTAKVRDERDHQTHPLITDFERQRIYDPLDAEYE
jgi:replicative DNA helicase